MIKYVMDRKLSAGYTHSESSAVVVFGEVSEIDSE